MEILDHQVNLTMMAFFIQGIHEKHRKGESSTKKCILDGSAECRGRELDPCGIL